MGLIDNVKTKLANFTKDVSKLTVTTVTGTIEISARRCSQNYIQR
jgi:hypothetical protein